MSDVPYWLTPEYREKKKQYDRERRARNKEWHRSQNSAYYKKNRDRVDQYRRDWYLRKKFGIGLNEYNDLVELQSGLCAICRRPPNGQGKLHVDHDHVTNVVRGLLCFSCNVAIGYLREDKETIKRMIDYLGYQL